MRNKLNSKQHEIISILSEECAEVIQIISKIHRFGLDSCHPAEPGITNLDNLHQEVGDLLAMVYLSIENGFLDEGMLEASSHRKIEKLKKWSTIFTEDKRD